MTKEIKIEDLKETIYWIEVKIDGCKRGWIETKRKSFTGKVKNLGVLGNIITFNSYDKEGKPYIHIAAPEKVKARVKLWNKEKYQYDNYKLIF